MHVGRVVAALVAVLLAVGCTRVVNGTVRPAPGLTPRPLTGQTVKRVLLDDRELAKMLGQSVKSNPNSPPYFGDSDQLYDIDSSPRECAGVVVEMQKSTYRSAAVRDVAGESWWNASPYGQHPAVIGVHEGVVALPRAKDAHALFAKLSEQWERCNGTTMTWYRSGKVFMTADISDVRAVDSMLAATVLSHLAGTMTNARAVGVRVNCLVEVEVALFSGHPAESTAVDIAHRMMDKVSNLS